MTKYKGIPVKYIQVKNFKSIVDCKIRLKNLTAIIGNNGTGKSSLIEALEFVRDVVVFDLETAFSGRLGGPEFIWNKSKLTGANRMRGDPRYSSSLMSFKINGQGQDIKLSYGFRVAYDNATMDTVVLYDEYVNTIDLEKEKRTDRIAGSGNNLPRIGKNFFVTCKDWVFLDLDPKSMERPDNSIRTKSKIRINRNGSNIAEYILSFTSRDGGVEAIDRIIEAMRYIISYAQDVTTEIAQTPLGRITYLQLSEQDFQLPSWLFSSGTLRALAMFAVLNDPSRPHLIAIEEIENGLDPRTLRLLIEEMRYITTVYNQQVIFTTHSPFALDLLEIGEVVIVERIEGLPVFSRFEDMTNLDGWNENFKLGALYTMGKLKTEKRAR